MQRETKELQLGSHKIVVKTFATTRELEGLRKAMHGAQQGTFDGMKEAELQLINCLVVSINGQTTNLADYCLDNMDFASEYTPLITELSEVLTKKKS